MASDVEALNVPGSVGDDELADEFRTIAHAAVRMSIIGSGLIGSNLDRHTVSSPDCPDRQPIRACVGRMSQRRPANSIKRPIARLLGSTAVAAPFAGGFNI